jgi:acyl-CoA hydrolase
VIDAIEAERTRRLVGIAHPKFRDELTAEAQACGYLSSRWGARSDSRSALSRSNDWRVDLPIAMSTL